MDDTLLGLVLARLDSVPLAEPAAGLLLAACDGDDSLADQLSGHATASVERDGGHVAAEPSGAFLRAVTVAGFRGVGPSATLDLQPGPGLTLVVGRNGSGKSSFAEGLEVLLTGDLKRWAELTLVWREGWRNLHAPEHVRISADLLLEGIGPATAERLWDGATRIADSRAFVAVSGEKRTGLDRLGWADALTTYRPFLSHTELEAFLGGPSHLYDLLSSVLGLEDLTIAEKRLSAARKERTDATATVARDLPALLERLGAVEDERASSCREALTGRKPDIRQALAIATGGPAERPDGTIGQLRQLSQLIVPGEAEVRDSVTALRAAADILAQAAGSEAGHALRLAGLLGSALDHYHAHGAGACPVCGRAGALDEEWRRRTEQEIRRLRGQASQAQQARALADNATAKARELLLPVPPVLMSQAVGSADPEPARAAWAAWAASTGDSGTDGLRKLAYHIEQAWPALHQTVTTLASSAAAELRAGEDRWAPVAEAVATWCGRARQAEAAAAAVPALKAAITWLKGATDEIRNARLAPLGEQARKVWAELRQESNVDLGAIRLSGSGTRRQVDVKVTVDGAPSKALGVMSQGEINALALSIFLPRATVADSPFRFLVIDDPVQAMDPAKVEGLARVLDDVSRTRQVLVFTHDDRLPEAVRRLGITARILEVTRRPGSVVEVRPALTPVERLLKDANDLCAEEALPEDVAARVVPGLCRLAVEAAFTEAIRRRQLRAGKRHAQVEAEIEAANTFTKRAALAMFDDAYKGGEVLRRLNAWQPAAATTYQALNKGAHVSHRGSLRPLVTEARQLTGLIHSRLS